MTEEALFTAALALASHAERRAFLDQACASDTGLRQRVEALLHAHDNPDSFLEAPSPGLQPTGDDPCSESPGTVIGPYKLLEQIGEGGFGVVFRAEQQQPVRRKVALKVLKPGMDTRQVIARFEAERQALALMDHPHIARVFDGGETATGRPYFVMELVKGVAITDYCDQGQLTLKDRLELFVHVCQAVQHAHQKGVIHRDLKPSNVLVTLHDGTPVVKVIDFGIAKASGQQLTEKTLFTNFAQLIGTPLYMSPEQAALSGLDVDTRSDIYSLGVLLYELLTGTTPFDGERFRQAGFDEMRRIIREEEPPKPSTRMSTLGQAATTVCTRRQSDPKRLSRLFQGELDWIVMKCLEKDRNRRYETANGLARDIERYLRDEPVLAGPPSARYRLRKFVRRNRGPVLAAALLGALLLLAVAGLTAGIIVVNGERNEKEQARQEAVASADEAAQAAEAERQAKELAQSRLGQIEKANELLAGIFHDLDPRTEEMGGPILQEQLNRRLEQVAAQLDGQAIGDPLTVARLQNTLGTTHLVLGNWRAAIELLTKARTTRNELLGPDDPDTLRSTNDLAAAYQAAGMLDEALPLFEQTLEKTKARLGSDHPDAWASMNNLALAYKEAGELDKALALFGQSLQKQQARFPADDPRTLLTTNNLALTHQAAGDLNLARRLFEQTLVKQQATLPPDHPDTLRTMNNLALTYQATGELNKALQLLEQVLEKEKARHGTDHPLTLRALGMLAKGHLAAGRLDKALPVLQQTLDKLKATLPPDNPLVLESLSALGGAYLAIGEFQKALPLFEQTLEGRKTKLGPNHPDTLLSMNNLAGAYLEAGRPDLALPLFEETLAKQKAHLPADHPHTLGTMNNLARAYRATRQLDKAVPLFEETLAKRKAKFRPGHPSTLTTMGDLASAYKARGQLDKAVPLFEETLAKQKVTFGPDHPSTLNVMNNLALAYVADGQLDKGLRLMEQTLEKKQAKLPPNHPDRLRTMVNLAGVYLDAGQRDKALPLLEEALTKQKATLGPAFPETFRTMNTLALAYWGAGKFDLAEPLWRELLAQRRKQDGADSPATAAVLASLGFTLLKQQKHAEASPVFRECLAIRLKKTPDAWPTFYTQSLLGEALLGQKKYTEAEPLLIQGYEGMRQREAQNPKELKGRLIEALERLVRLYKATGQKAEAEAWAKKLAQAKAVEKKPK
jgi:serine/threonine protein kinase/lipopolysaccharide biosynthesis regulator YciM